MLTYGRDAFSAIRRTKDGVILEIAHNRFVGPFRTTPLVVYSLERKRVHAWTFVSKFFYPALIAAGYKARLEGFKIIVDDIPLSDEEL